MFVTILKLIISLILPIIFSVIFYLAEKKTSFKKITYWQKQLIIGVVFGLLAVISTHFGIETEGAVINVRDAAPLSAGLIFGGPAGIIAGLIGGVERFFASFWGIGQSTQLACSLATLCAGFFAALMRKFIFDNKIPSVFYGLLIGITTEVFHMLLIYFTNLSNVYDAFEYIQDCTLSMTLGNGITTMLSILSVSLADNKKSLKRNKVKKIEYTFRSRLLICVMIAFLVTSVFSFTVENHLAITETEYLLVLNIYDAQNSIKNKDKDNVIDESISNLALDWHVGGTGCIIISDKNGIILSDSDGHTGESVAENGIDLNNASNEENEIFTSQIHGKDSFCMYSDEGDYYIIASITEEEALYSRIITMYVTVFIEIIVFTSLFVFIFFLIKKVVVKNIDKINNSLAKITDGDLNETVNVRSNEEFAVLSDDINSTVDTLKRYIKEADERIDKELEFARQIQHSALPSVFPPYPNRTDFDIYAQMYTAKEVGGDFYDFYLIGEDKLAFLIADVSGKGIPAAMFMMTAKTLIKSLVESGIEPSDAFTQANNKLCENNEAGMFVTAWLGILDLNTGLLKYVNAGHNPPLIKRNGQYFEYLCAKPNFILAGMENIKYKANELQLSPGDEIFLYTDGVTEANDISNELFGEDRLLESLNENDRLRVNQLCYKVKCDVDKFVGNALQFDDITMLAVKLNCLLSNDSIVVSPDKDSMNLIYNFIDNKLKELSLDKSIANKIKLVTDEMYSNITNYSGATRAKVSFFKTDKSIYLTFSDNGKPYNPLAKENPDTSLSANDRDEGGLGIYIVKKTASSIDYSNKDGFNILTVTFE
ncbi:MAG: SpoIIE family protein phosphatase [Ruminococcus sp.]